MNNEAILSDFETWLTHAGYRKSTIRRSVQDVRQLFTWSAEGRAIPRRLGESVKRLLAYFDKRDIEPQGRLRDAIDAALAPPPERTALEKRRASQARKRRQQTSYPDEAWRKLWAAIQADVEAAARVLEVMATTGLRVGDVLRLSRHRLTTGFPERVITIEQKGGDDRLIYIEGQEIPWLKLLDAFSDEPPQISTVAWLVAPDGDGSPLSADAAYRAVERKLKKIGRALDIEGPHRTHRLRRTVAVQALRVTEDVVLVQQLMGHKSAKTTLGYVSEARPEQEAELRRRLAQRFRQQNETE